MGGEKKSESKNNSENAKVDINEDVIELFLNQRKILRTTLY